MSFVRLPKTAKKVYMKRIDSDIDVYYILPATGRFYTRVFLNRKCGQAYNTVNDTFPEQYFKDHIRRSVKPISLATWEKAKAAIKRK